jgi:hypothetical protein
VDPGPAAYAAGNARDRAAARVAPGAIVRVLARVVGRRTRPPSRSYRACVPVHVAGRRTRSHRDVRRSSGGGLIVRLSSAQVGGLSAAIVRVSWPTWSVGARDRVANRTTVSPRRSDHPIVFHPIPDGPSGIRLMRVSKFRRSDPPRTSALEFVTLRDCGPEPPDPGVLVGYPGHRPASRHPELKTPRIRIPDVSDGASAGGTPGSR